tara:strand:+ start:71 stop:493 length:423 start_codon:yes stop_codon:yes gene_type:complete
MKYLFFLLLTFVFFSCSSPLERTYDKVGFSKDIVELKGIVTEEELNELEVYIELSSQLGVNLVGKTYNELLDDIETSKNNEINRKNDYVRINIQELLNQRLKNDLCDDYILEVKKNGIHKHNKQANDSVEWYEDVYYIDY